ncbi:MAG: 3-deoxy-D-manno-octulosonic acid transferase [Nitrospirota bacterium]
MYFLYNLLYCIILFFIFPFQYLTRPKELRGKWLREKFGFIYPSMSPLIKGGIKGGSGGIIWVHAVSVGEVMAAQPLLKKLREKYPSKEIVLSTITDTGRKVAKETAPENTKIVYLPFDITIALKSAIRMVKPEILIIIETELWPTMFRVFKKSTIPVILLNGRISEKSFRGYKRISFFMKEVLSNVDFFGMQGEIDAERMRGIGVDKSKITVLGNFKFDMRPPSKIPQWTEKIKGPVIIAGSTHDGEEELIVSVYNELKKDFPDLNLIIAPRHPERFKDVEEMLRSKGMPFLKRSQLVTRNSKPDTFNGVILLDTVGELSAIYGITDIAIIGKSFRGYGGQNPLEPAYWGKPIICGPHMENFPIISDFYREGAAIEVNEEDLHSKLKELLLSPERAKEIGSKAQGLYRKNAGAVGRAMEIVGKFISE